MKKEFSLGVSLSKRIAFTAVFAALCCVCTLFSVPLPNGYFNPGDVFVLLSGWCLGPIYGFFAAAVGSALSDVILAYAIYAPATFFVKGLDAILAYFVWSALKKSIKNDLTARSLAALVGETLMVLGYFLFESALSGSFAASAVASIPGNALQGVCCAVCAVGLVLVLSRIKAVRQFFPLLSKDEPHKE